MGILADLFVADPNDARGYESAIRDESEPPRGFDRYEAKGLTDLDFSILWSILEDQTWDIQKHKLETVLLEKGGETWTFGFPQAFVAKLAALEASQLPRVTSTWAKTEELACDPRHLQPVVEALVRLARLATSSGKGLFLWGSL